MEPGTRMNLAGILDVLGISYRNDRGENKIRCPHPEHDDTTPSCSANTETGLWNCHSCGAKGDVYTLAIIRPEFPCTGFSEAQEFIDGGAPSGHRTVANPKRVRIGMRIKKGDW